jgi:SAM-dependent methyltransferase
MSSAIEPAIVLAAYAEPVASGRRVLFIGPAVSALPARLLERGARLVHVCDPDPVRVAEATAKNRSSSLSFSALADGHFALRDGAFDVCIVQDAGITEPVALVKKLRKALTPRGVAILASANPDVRSPLMPHRQSGVISLDYYALYDAVKAEFEHVRMLGQAPFVGYVIADFAPEGTPEPSLDTAFLPSGAEEPELFIAVASQQRVELEAFAVVQLPYRSVISGSTSDGEALRRARGSEQAARDKLASLEAELSQLKASAQGHESALSALKASTAAREGELGSLKANAAAREGELGKLKASYEAALAAERQSVAARDAKLRETETKVFARDAELTALRQELENKNNLLKAQAENVAELARKLAQGPAPEEAAAAANDLAALEQALTERGEHIRKLERDLREAERVGKELLRQLPPAADPALAAAKAAESELAQKLAKSQADLIATRWALESAVKRGGSSVEAPEA